MSHFVPLVGVEDGGSDVEEGGVGGGRGCGLAPDYAVEDGRGH